jgi:hypothetical protein
MEILLFIKDLFYGFLLSFIKTLLTIIFYFFIKKWFYKFINKHISQYYLNYNLSSGIIISKILQNNEDISESKLEIIELYTDLDLRIVTNNNNNYNVYLYTINNYNIDIRTFFNIFLKILKNLIIKQIDNKTKLDYSINVSKHLSEQIKKILAFKQ